MNLDFLNEISLEVTPQKETQARTAVDKAPTNGAHLRLFKDGRIYPSQELVDEYNLEYVAKGEEVGQGFDIVDTQNFPNYPEGSPRILMIAYTSKDNPKVDLFGSTGYNEDGTPKSSVTSQGTSTTGKWLIPLLEEVYDVELFPEGVRYVDLMINTEFELTTPNNIYHMPKTVTRGEKKGEVTYVRRTDTALCPLTIMEDVVKEEEAVVEEVVEETIL